MRRWALDGLFWSAGFDPRSWALPLHITLATGFFGVQPQSFDLGLFWNMPEAFDYD